jgi:Domain of unknown function (DUF4192)
MNTSTYCPVSRTLGRRPEELLPAIPYLLGYTPTDSLVCLFFDNAGVMRLSSRVDWQTCRVAPEDVATTLTQRALNNGAVSALVAAMDPADPSLAVVAELSALFLDEGLALDWAGECHGTHWVGLECTAECGRHVMDPHCPTVLELIAEGVSPAADRGEIVAEVAADDDDRLDSLQLAAVPAGGADREVWRDTTIEDCMGLLHGNAVLTDRDVALVAAACADIRVRDVVLWRLTVGDGPVSVRSPRTWDVISQVLRRVPDDAVAPVAAVAALVAWQRGEGTRAMECLKRAHAADPDHSLAALVFRCVDAAQPPSLWWQVMAGLDEDTCRNGAAQGRVT